MIWKRLFYVSACLTLLFGATALYLHVSDIESAEADITFEPTGNTSHDVLQLLVGTGRMEAMPSNAQTQPARQAIRVAEREFGLVEDGVPDQTLLDELVARKEAKRATSAATGRFTLDDGIKLTTIITGIGTLLLGFLKFWRSDGTKEAKSF